MRVVSFRRLRGFFHDRDGAVSIMVAAFGVGLIASLALAIDVASLYLQKRRDQGALDLAVLAAARSFGSAEQAARASLAANGIAAPQSLKVVLGRYDPDATKPVAQRFSAGGAPVNAVKLEMQRAAPIVFGKVLLASGEVPVATAATAVNTRVASFSIGTRLLSVNGGLANAVLSKLLGAEISLSAMDYNALASTQVDMPDLLNALAPRVGVQAGTYDSVLATNPKIGDFAQAIGAVAGVSSEARSALSRVAALGSSRSVGMRQLLSFGPFARLALGQTTGLSARASTLDVLLAAAEIANGRNQVNVDLAAQVPGLLGLSASVVIGERPQTSPWMAIGAESVTVTTTQARIRLVASVKGPVGLATLRLPIAIDLASGRATLTAASCGRSPKTDAQATLAVTPSLADSWIGDPVDLPTWFDPSKPKTVGAGAVVSTLVASVTAFAHVAATNMQPTSVTFSADDIAQRKVKTVGTTQAAQTAIASLLGNLSLTVTTLGLSLGTPTIATQPIKDALTPVGSVLDPVLSNVLGLLGVGVGQADVTVLGLRCDGSTLVL